MIPKPPPNEGNLGFLYLPPFRVQGVSVAGEATSIMVPELDVCFDAGSCPRACLPAKYLAVSHGHMDHTGALAYWCSQRRFQGMGDGTILCDKRIESDIREMMNGFIKLERQETPYTLVALEPEQRFEIKNNLFLECFHTEHTAPSVGYSIVERRTKLKEEFREFPQEKLREIKESGTEITNEFFIPLVAYIGDTLPGPHLLRDDVRRAKIIITECTFFEKEHKERAKIGQHLHVDDIAEWLPVTECEAMVITHISRRTHLGFARKELDERLSRENAKRAFLLMDHRTNKARYEQQAVEAGVIPPPPQRRGPRPGGHGGGHGGGGRHGGGRPPHARA